MKPAVAVVGLGKMGSAMALRLRECGLDVLGWDVDACVRARVALDDIPVAASLSDALSKRDFILTSLPDSAAVRSVWLSPDGLIALADPDSICIDLSTIEPETIRQAARAALPRNIDMLDCPVSGGPVEARSGTLVVMAGGAADVIERAQPVLGCLGGALHHTGGIGTAKVVKIINNMMAMGNLLIACEAFSLGMTAGVEPGCLFSVLAECGGTSKTFTKRFPFALRGDFAPRFKLELAEKDLALGLSMAASHGAQVPAAAVVHELFRRAMGEGFQGQDAVALLAMYRRWADKPDKMAAAASESTCGR